MLDPDWWGDPAIDAGDGEAPRIGAYRLLRKIASGGMGVVYLAERADEAFTRFVAIKLIGVGADGTEIGRRFQEERQILAKLDHPNIARLLDGGETANGQPFFVMEYVDGLSLSDYCRERTPDLTARLTLFQSICDAVQYAHQNLVVHRDLKPGNILVTRDGTVKLLDFGIAKILSADAEGDTRTIFQFLTPAYASPEHLRGETITTTSDVYSLGVLLYELLTYRRPFDTRSPQEALRRIEAEEPPRPSTVCPLDSPRLQRQLRGDLDNIVMRALQRDPARRYQSARELSEDLTRYLRGEPVRARDATWRYRAGKFVRRNRVQVLLAGIAIASLVGVTAREVQLRLRAEREARAQRAQIYAAQMQRTLQDWNDGNLRRMRETLAAWETPSGGRDLRGFEWRFLKRLLSSAVWTRDVRGGVIHALTRSPDGRLLAAGMSVGAVRLFDSQSGNEIAALGDRGAVIRGVAFSPDGSRLAACDAAGLTRLWEVATGRELVRVQGHNQRIVFAVAFSPDGRFFATAGKDGIAKLWETETGSELRAFRGHAAGVRGVAFSPDGRRLYTAGDDTTVREWEVATGRARRVFVGMRADVLSLVVTPDAKFLAASGSDPRICLWDLATGNLVRTLEGHRDDIWRLALSQDGKILGSASADRTARLWDIVTGRQIEVIRGHDLEVSFFVFAPAGKRVITGESRRLIAWDLDRLPGGRVFRPPDPCRITSLSLSPDAKNFALGLSSSGDLCKAPAGISMVEADTGKVRWTRSSESLITAVGLIPFSDRAAYVSVSGRAGILEALRGARILEYAGHLAGQGERTGSSSVIWAMAVSPDGGMIATGSSGNQIKLWTPDGREIHTLWGPGPATAGEQSEVYSLAFSNDSRKVAAGGFDAGVSLFDVATGQMLLRVAPQDHDVRALQFSPDGRILATAGVDSVIRLWDTRDGRLLRELTGHADQIRCLAWTPDGNRLASAGKDRTIRLWDPDSSLEVLTLKEHADVITGLAFSADGSLLVSASWDQTVRFWPALASSPALKK